jgi:hypothetical protein
MSRRLDDNVVESRYSAIMSIVLLSLRSHMAAPLVPASLLLTACRDEQPLILPRHCSSTLRDDDDGRVC